MGAIPNCKSSCMKNERLQEKYKTQVSTWHGLSVENVCMSGKYIKKPVSNMCFIGFYY